MFDLIVPDILSHDNEYERAMEYMRWKGRCRTLFGNVPAEIVSSNSFPVCRAEGLPHTLICFQRSRGFAI